MIFFQVLIDFFISHSSCDAELVPLANVFNYLFMDPLSDVQVGQDVAFHSVKHYVSSISLFYLII